MVKGLPAEWGECFRTVTPRNSPWVVACWKDIIAGGCFGGDIIIIDKITGSQKAVLSGHTNSVTSVTFSSDGTFLVSGGWDNTVKLWDVQTGGVVKTFHGHTTSVLSVSISGDCTMIASGSDDRTIRLWDIQTKECLHVVEQQEEAYHVCFSPMDSQSLISASDGKVWEWDISGCKINPVHGSSHVTFSLDKIQLVLCQGVLVAVQHSDEDQLYGCCCLIPGGRLIAVAAGSAINIWDVTGSDPHLIKTYVGHSRRITSLVFSSPSSLISSSDDGSVKFWQIADLLRDPAVINLESTPLASAPIKCITLQAKDGIAISGHSGGVVTVWDILTGHSKASFQTPAKELFHTDALLINNRLIYVWTKPFEEMVYIWDTEKGEYQIVDTKNDIMNVKISGDGSRVYSLQYHYLESWSILTGEGNGRVKFEGEGYGGTLTVDGSRVWAHIPNKKIQGWDFGISGSSPVELSVTPPVLNSTKVWNRELSRIQNPVTGKVVFQLGGRLKQPTHLQWDGQYLVAGYHSGEVLILDFGHVLSQ